MKRLYSVLIAVMFLASASASYAASDELVTGMGDKLWIGLVNTFTGWVELPAQIVKGYNEGFMGDESSKVLGAVAGIFDGFGHAAGRTFSGMTDLFGFWAASPETNDGAGIPLDAEYAWEEGEPYNIFEPTFTDGAVMPVGKKLVRGLGNAFLGVAEVPGQIVKGIQEGAPDIGIVKGLWYWMSRSTQGFSDIMTCVLPNPKETKGLAFDEEYPWDALVNGMQ